MLLQNYEKLKLKKIFSNTTYPCSTIRDDSYKKKSSCIPKKSVEIKNVTYHCIDRNFAL